MTAMNLAKKSLRLALIAPLTLGALSACGESDSESAADALTKVETVYDNALTVCTDMPYAPFEYEEGGKVVGFDMDLTALIAEDLDLQFDPVTTPFDDINSGKALNDGVCDMAVSAMSITGERARVLDFSSPYFDAKQVLLAKNSAAITSMNMLAGKKVGVQGGTTGATFLSDNAPNTATIVPFKKADELDAALDSGAVDAAIYDDVAAAAVVKSLGDIKVIDSYDTGEQYGMAVKKDGNIPLLRKINDSLAKAQSNGSYDEIYKKYFG